MGASWHAGPSTNVKGDLVATLAELLDTTLPLNRKERYYTGTVLPALLCADSMRHLHRLGRPDLLGIGPLDVRADVDDCTVLFFTEYSLLESAVGPIRDRFPDLLGLPKDTPDVVILVTEPAPVLIALEAKLYDRPSQDTLNGQLRRQRAQLEPLCTTLADALGVPQVRLAHFALLPAQLAATMPDLDAPVLTWQQVRAAYADVDQDYFLAVLDEALARYERLVSAGGSNQQGLSPGGTLVTDWLAGTSVWQFAGARDGLTGPRIQAAVADGSWRSIVLQVRADPLPGNRNWFAVAELVDLLRAAGQLPPLAGEPAPRA